MNETHTKVPQSPDPILLSLPSHALPGEFKKSRNRRIAYSLVLLGGLACVGYWQEALRVLGPWTCLTIAAGSTYILWIGMRKGQKIYLEVCLDSEGIRRIDQNGTEERYHWSELKDMDRHPYLPIIAWCRFKHGARVAINLGGDVAVDVETLRGVTAEILHWTNLPDFFQQLQEFHFHGEIIAIVRGFLCLLFFFELVYRDYFGETFLGVQLTSVILLLCTLYLGELAVVAIRRRRLIRRRPAR